MGYGLYENVAGRECGYGVEAMCDHPGCVVDIDRGYSFLCGTTDRIQSEAAPGCGKYFCEKHLRPIGQTAEGDSVQLCEACRKDPRSLAFVVDDEEGEDD